MYNLINQDFLIEVTMDDLPDVYQLETLEQLRTFADALRQRILDALSRQQLTAKQLATLLSEPPQKVHYHVRELERVGLVRLVETRERGGILEKYYRAVARDFSVPSTLLRALPRDEQVQEIGLMLSRLTQGFLDAFAAAEPRGESVSCSVLSSSLWLTRDEYERIQAELRDLVDRYNHQPDGDRREYSFGALLYTVKGERMEHS